MITDQETNLIYFSELLPRRHPKFFGELKARLERKGIECLLLPHTKDIWCRDYMPVQVSKNEFVQFKYEPSYLTRYKEYTTTITDAAETCKAIGISPKRSDINLDGGNIVKSRNKAIMTARIFAENPRFLRKKLLSKLKTLFKVKQVVIIPECPFDRFGHADGMIRFVDGVKDEETVLVNDFSGESAKFFSKFHRAISSQGLFPVLLPYTAYRNKGDDAKGIYTNYLEVGKIVIYPVYGIKEDALAHKVFYRYFGGRIFPIRANEIAREGGVLNCVSWNIKR
ncbi:MAG: agmatine deiminase family protein [Candidatus Omnitrophica bacterium]|nr:agmatine deiminase family protein [Candidatus Omnitrophota bacterium]MBU4478216.1 agmatine deiminase family protein [Candidatus Omnitrophota bacterium]